jgi:hypothetical protein
MPDKLEFADRNWALVLLYTCRAHTPYLRHIDSYWDWEKGGYVHFENMPDQGWSDFGRNGPHVRMRLSKKTPSHHRLEQAKHGENHIIMPYADAAQIGAATSDPTVQVNYLLHFSPDREGNGIAKPLLTPERQAKPRMKLRDANLYTKKVTYRAADYNVKVTRQVLPTYIGAAAPI